MADKPLSHRERLGRILDSAADYLEHASWNELLEDAREEGRDPAQTLKRVKSVLSGAVKDHDQRALKEAKEAYLQEVANLRSCPIKLPGTPEGRRNLLATVFSQQPQLRPAFTFQNRDFTELTDDDVEHYLRKLALLGILDQSSLNDNE